MKSYLTFANNGPQPVGDVPSVSDWLQALSPQHYQHLINFARYRLRAVTSSRRLQRCLAIVEPEDLVAEAILKLQLGEADRSLGRHVRPENRTSPERFLACIKGVIESDLNHLVISARHRYEHLELGDPELDADLVDPAAPEDPRALLSRRDLHRVLFTKLYQRIERQPALLEVVRDWEARFHNDDRIGNESHDPNLVHRVRQLARTILEELALEAELPQGREVLL